jgi:acyl-CoA synthetase (AMP-forming)/AMP-acid ligase II
MLSQLPSHIKTMDVPVATEADTLRRHAALRPDHTAIIFEGRDISYLKLDRRASQVANGLLTLQPQRQSQIALLDKNSDQFFELVFGIAKSRNIAMPVNWRLSPREIAQIVMDAGARILFIGAGFAHIVPDLRANGAELDHVFIIGADSYRDWREAQAATDPMLDVTPDDVFIQLYTSGTTGKPKGVQITHGSSMLMRKLEVSTGGKWTEWGPDDKVVVAMPNFHVGGTSWALQWFARGATCVVQTQVDPRALLDAIDKYGLTHIFTVPTVLSMMLADETCAGRDFSRLKVIHYGASPISPSLLVRCIKTFGTEFVQYYGMTETNGVLCVLQPHEHDLHNSELLKSVGKPYPPIDLRILDQAGAEVPRGAVGEVCVDTPCLMKGYWRLPEATASSMTGTYYRTGDAGYMTEAGYVFLVDRIKDMIVSGGENIYPIEVENVIAEHPAVSEVAVIGVPDQQWGETVKAFVVTPDKTLTQEAILAFMLNKIARYKMPKVIEFVDTLPRNPAGKLLKRELRSYTKPPAAP